MIEIKNYSKSYVPTKKAVDNINLTVEDGDIYGFVGLNGAGKSTTIKSIVGILDFEEGDILINGKSVKAEPIACKSDIAYVADNPDVYGFMKGYEFVKFILAIYNKPFDEARMMQLAEELEIEKALADPISTYSHGMKQKIVLLASFLHDPKVFILDEPFVGLDPKATFILKEKMRSLSETGVCFFFSTHVLEVAEKLCNKVAIIKEGKLISSGKMEEVIGDKSLEDIFLGLSD